jgi:Fe-S-cluster-containing dehydrogenase component
MIDRRSLLTIAGAGAVGLAAAQVGHAVNSEPPVQPPQDAVGLLYDTTLCVGCKACVAACSRANNLIPASGQSGGLYQEPVALDAHTKNIIKLYKSSDGRQWSFMKQQCMHCVDPACVLACPLSALEKGEFGIVSWKGETCLGCRCCQIACPYNIPKFEWSQLNPRVVKCEMCRQKLARNEAPACTAVCPRKAVIFGKRTALLTEAKSRIAANPGRYYQDRVYGEHEGGGTQSLYLSHLPFAMLGLPDLGTRSIASGVRNVQETIYQHGVTPVVAYSALVVLTGHFWKDLRHHAEDEADWTGLKEQI